MDADSRPVRVVVFDGEAVRLPVPAFLLDCLLLVHSQDYLAVIAKAAQASTTTAAPVGRWAAGHIDRWRGFKRADTFLPPCLCGC